MFCPRPARDQNLKSDHKMMSLMRQTALIASFMGEGDMIVKELMVWVGGDVPSSGYLWFYARPPPNTYGSASCAPQGKDN